MTDPHQLTAATREVIDWLFDESVLHPDQMIDADVERAARLLFLDTLGCAIGGGAKPELRALNEAMAEFEPGPAALPGMVEPLTAPAAASWCATAATWDEACEGLARAHGRPGLHAFPVAVTLTLAKGGTFGEALVALIRGFEVGGRLGERLRIQAGMHVDGTWGTFGAATAAGSVLQHGPSDVAATIEASACQTPMSLYLPVAQGATIRNSYVAESVRRAIALSIHVASGVTTPTGALEAVDGMAFGERPTDTGVAPPGEWLISQGYLKPFAAVRHVHYGAEAARRWRELERPTTAIHAISFDVYPEAVTYCANRAPATAIAAQFSLTYGIARMLATGDLGPEAYATTSLRDPEVRRLEQLIDVRAVPGDRPDERYATLRITTEDAGEYQISVDQVTGDADSPMTSEEVVDKFLAYSRRLRTWPAEQVAASLLRGPLEAPLQEVLALDSQHGA
ncbi:MAG: MmgE/PrpD family protein [Acidimicrobiales bacterium]